jgi:hypothetical protein
MAYWTRTHERVRGTSVGLFTVLYLGAGLVVAGIYDYFENVNTFERGIEAALAVLLWPLVLLGVEMRID